MNQTQASSRERFLTTATELFLRHGFGPVGLDQIIDAVGVTKTTFYKHFDGKDALILEVLAHQHALEMRNIVEQIRRRRPDDPRGQILAIFDALDEWFTAPDFGGCIFIKAATEFPHKQDPIHRAAIVHAEDLHALVRELAVAAGAGAAEADALAVHMQMLIHGAVVSRQVQHAMDAGKHARRMAEVMVRSALP